MINNHELSARITKIKPSPTLAVAAKAERLQRSGKAIINLSVGEPDFDTPNFIKEAAIKAIKVGHTKYTAVEGILSLKEAIIEKFETENQLNFALNQIIVSCGAKHSLFNLFLSILDAADEVIIPTPYWVSYPDMALLADAKPVIIETNFTSQFKMTPAQLKAAITPKTKLIILNSPSNPTGMAYSLDELRLLGEVLCDYPHIYIVSDDIYEHILWAKPFANILNACPALKNQVIVVNGVSKAYAMTGWRIGYAAGPEAIIAAMKKAQSQSTSNPTSISQYASVAALQGDSSIILKMNDAYKERHHFLHSALNQIPGFECLPSDGTFYCFPNIQKCLQGSIKDDIAFSEYLLDEAEVAVVPGSAFGASGYIRLSFATHQDNLENAILRIDKAVKKLF